MLKNDILIISKTRCNVISTHKMVRLIEVTQLLLAKEKILILTEKISKNISCIRLSSIVINDNDIL